ncbi:hypothetical protein PFTANZ_00026 [Plasmodium falciparum Tanzania (2000708)]|uniref:Uncharacterized protein n=1 Tax=Plasmodium falciparum Tanzania (2000708) TaxID=1036725 RepID=A0A024WEN9_PLAFA|nr:hypothetical protein PFTANZ_00026 [Plasmodium falciparum Tanzania (2000708)]
MLLKYIFISLYFFCVGKIKRNLDIYKRDSLKKKIKRISYVIKKIYKNQKNIFLFLNI